MRQDILIFSKQNSLRELFLDLELSVQFFDWAHQGLSYIETLSKHDLNQFCVLIDTGITDMSWLTVIQQLYDYSVELKLVVLDQKFHISTAVSAIKNGADDYWDYSSLSQSILDKFSQLNKEKLSKKMARHFY